MLAHDPNFIGLVNKKEFLSTIEYYIHEQLPRTSNQSSEVLIRIILDNTCKTPTYNLKTFELMSDEELKLAIKICLVMDIGGKPLIDAFDYHACMRRNELSVSTQVLVAV